MTQTTPAAAPIAEVVDGYLTMWNETDPVRRRAAIAAFLRSV